MRIYYIIREITREEERTSQPLCISNGRYTLAYALNPNDDASPFIENTRVTSYEITKVLLMCSPSFTGYEASRLDCFSAMHLRGATLHCRFRVLLQSEASKCSSGVITSCYSGARLRSYPQRETLNLSSLFTKSASPLTLGFARGISQSNLVQGLCPEPSGGASRHLPTLMTT